MILNNDGKPDFLIIGAAKCGTTSLYKRMSMHPQIFMSTPKEPEYFARNDVFNKGDEYYQNLFSDAEERQICGEASTLYSLTTCFPKTVSRMHNTLPNAKLIYVLRDPIDRAYSYYTQLVKNYQNATKDFSVNRTFEECIFPDNFPKRKGRDKFFSPYDYHLKDQPETFLDGSMYMTNIHNYLEFYNRENLLLIRFEDLVENLAGVANQVCDFLNIDSSLFSKDEIVRENISNEYFITLDKEIYKRRVISKFKSIPFVEMLSKFMPTKIRRSLMEKYSGILAERNDNIRPQKMDDITRSYLKEKFRAEINELEVFWGQNLEKWK